MYLLHVSTTQGHLQATHYFKESATLHTLSVVPLSTSYSLYNEYTSTQDTQDQESGTPNGAQSSHNTKDRRKGHPIT
jgi:hypothetical protein